MSYGDGIFRIAIATTIFGFMLVAIDLGQAGYAGLFGMLFGTALERLILTAPRS